MVDRDSNEHEALQAAIDGDGAALGEVLASYRDRIHRMIDARLDDRLRGRIDASDVIQEAFADVATRLPTYVKRPEVSFFLWVRYITGVKLDNLHRHHFQYQKRDARREQGRFGGVPEASSFCLAELLADGGPTPSEVAIHEEQREIVERALNSMNPDDRELLALRHLESLDNDEIAELLGTTVNAVNIRYYRAAQRLAQHTARLRDAGPE